MTVAVQRVVAVLDLGSSQVTSLIGEVTGEPHSWGLRVHGVGVERSNGVRRGVVRDFEETVRAIRKAMSDAERIAGIEVGTVYCGVAGELIAQRQTSAVVSIPGSEIRTADVARVIDVASTVSFGNDQELLHAIPQGYRVDGVTGYADPIGMTGEQVEADIYLVTARSSGLAHQRRAIEKAGWHVGEVILEPLAASLAVLSAEEREIGSVLVELGAGSTTLSIFHGGRLRYTASLRFAGNHLTTDLAQVLRITQAEAERIKVRWGAAFKAIVPAGEQITLAASAGQPALEVERGTVADIMGHRLRETLEMACDEVARAGWSMAGLPGGVVLSGGGASIPGVLELTRDIFAAPVRIATPAEGLRGLVDRVAGPSWAVPVGLALYGARQVANGGGFTAAGRSTPAVERVFGPVRRWLQDFF